MSLAYGHKDVCQSGVKLVLKHGQNFKIINSNFCKYEKIVIKILLALRNIHQYGFYSALVD